MQTLWKPHLDVVMCIFKYIKHIGFNMESFIKLKANYKYMGT